MPDFVSPGLRSFSLSRLSSGLSWTDKLLSGESLSRACVSGDCAALQGGSAGVCGVDAGAATHPRRVSVAAAAALDGRGRAARGGCAPWRTAQRPHHLLRPVSSHASITHSRFLFCIFVCWCLCLLPQRCQCVHVGRRLCARRDGVCGARLEWRTHLVVKALANLSVDNPVFNAHTSGVDMLWAGVPLLTTPGQTMSSRVAASLLLSGPPSASTLVRPTLRFASLRSTCTYASRLLMTASLAGVLGRSRARWLSMRRWRWCWPRLRSARGSRPSAPRCRSGSAMDVCCVLSVECESILVYAGAFGPCIETGGTDVVRRQRGRGGAELFDTAMMVRSLETGLRMAWTARSEASTDRPMPFHLVVTQKKR